MARVKTRNYPFCLGRVVPNVGGQTLTDNGNTFTNLPDDSVLETCPPATAIAETLARHIAANGGTAIIVDYGRWGNIGATLQAVRDHKKTDPLADAGMNDISALVDFRALARAVRPFAQVQCACGTGGFAGTAGHSGTDGTAGDWAYGRGFGESYWPPINA